MNKSFLITEDNVSYYAAKIGCWIYEQVENAKRKGVVLGMSGGIDCAVVARLCQKAGVDVELLMLPCGYSMSNDGSYNHSMELIEEFDFSFNEHNIEDAFYSIRFLEARDEDKDLRRLSDANIKARVRMTFLYQYAQLTHRFVIGTSNLSERYVGYCTKWGDMACDLNPLGNITKREIYVLAKYLDIPESIINKAPSAGLWAGQTDEDEMGFTYEYLDNYILYGHSGLDAVDEEIEKRHENSKHKRNPIIMYEN